MRERLHHLATVENIQSTEFSRWADTRLDRWLVDWCLRYGKEQSARMIAKQKGIEVCDLEMCFSSYLEASAEIRTFKFQCTGLNFRGCSRMAFDLRY